MRVPLAAAVVVWLASGAVRASSPPATLVGSAAPGWDGVAWVAGAPAGGLDPARLRGRVVVLSFFRGDSDDGLAALADVARRYAAVPDVAFVAIQWLGWRHEPIGSVEAGRERLGRAGLGIPHGAVAGEPGRADRIPAARYAVSAYPWTTVIDRGGVVRFEGRTREAARLAAEVEALRSVPGAANPLVGRPFGATPALRHPTPDGRPPPSAPGTLTLYRWWTNACAFCTDSLPALARLERRYGPRGLRLVAVYHPKGRPLSDAAAVAYARGLGVTGAVAFDDRWAKYVELRDRGGLREATSVSLLVDSEGVVRWVHPGPRLHESSGGHARAAADLAALDALLDRTLPPAPTR
jgi:hypothetical protein